MTVTWLEYKRIIITQQHQTVANAIRLLLGVEGQIVHNERHGTRFCFNHTIIPRGIIQFLRTRTLHLLRLRCLVTKRHKTRRKHTNRRYITSSLADLSCLGGVAGDACESRSGSTLLVRLLSVPRFYKRKSHETKKQD